MIQTVATIALSIIFIHALFWDGMLLGSLRRSWLTNLPLWVRKPLYECAVCMTSLWGTFAYLVMVPNPTFLSYIGIILPVGGSLLMLRGMLNRAQETYIEYYVLANLSKQAIKPKGCEGSSTDTCKGIKVSGGKKVRAVNK